MKLHKFELGLYPIIVLLIIKYNLPCTISVYSLIMPISSSHRSLAYGVGQDTRKRIATSFLKKKKEILILSRLFEEIVGTEMTVFMTY